MARRRGPWPWGLRGVARTFPVTPRCPVLSWDELARDLRLARHWSDDLFIHSLEGCVWQGFLGRLRSFDWGQAVTPPKTTPLAEGLRRVLRETLWASARPWRVLSVVVGTTWLVSRWRRRA